MPVEMGTYDVIIGMDWLTKYQARIDWLEDRSIPFWDPKSYFFNGDGRKYNADFDKHISSPKPRSICYKDVTYFSGTYYHQGDLETVKEEATARCYRSSKFSPNYFPRTSRSFHLPDELNFTSIYLVTRSTRRTILLIDLELGSSSVRSENLEPLSDGTKWKANVVADALSRDRTGNHRQGRTSETVEFVGTTRDTSMEVDKYHMDICHQKHPKSSQGDVPKEVSNQAWITWAQLFDIVTLSFASKFFLRSLQESFGNKLRYEYGIPSLNRRTTRENHSNSLKDMLRACVIDFGNVQETTDRIIQLSKKKGMQAARELGKRATLIERKPIEFEVGYRVMLKVSPWNGVYIFGKRGKLNPDDLDMGSPGVEGPIFEVPPSPDYIPGPEGPPSPDYVPGPEEPEQAPPSPIYIPFVPEPVYPEFLPVDDEGGLEEDPEEDPADYPADRGDRDDEESSDDDDAEEEHLAPADPAAVAYSADQDPYIAYRVTARMSIRPQAPAPFLSEEIPSPPLPIPSPVHETEMPEICLPLNKMAASYSNHGPGYVVWESSAAGPLGRLDMPLLGKETAFHRCMALLMEEEARLSRAAWARSMDACDQVHSEGISLRTTIVAQQSEITELQAADLKSLKTQMIELQRQQGPAKDPAEPELPEEANLGFIYRLLRKANEVNPGTTSPTVTDLLPPTSVTSAQLQAMIDEGVTAVLAARATTRNGDDSHTSGTGVRRNERTVRECTYQDFMKCQPLFFRGTEGVVNLTQWFERMETVFRISNCTVENQVKFATCTLMGTALTWWNSHARTVTNEVAYAMTWSDLKKKMTTKYCPRNEIKKVEAELWNLKVQGTDVVAYNQRFQELALLCDRMFPEETDKIERYVGGMPDLIYSSVVASKPKTMQEAIEMATELMDRRINTLAERQTENKRKFEDAPRNNQNQQPNKRQNTGRAYLGHLAKDCRSRPATANNNNNNRNNNNNNNRNNNNNNNRNNNNPRAQGANTNAIICFECGAPGHFKKDCPQWKNKNQGNGNAVARAYAVGVAGQNPDNNVVTGTFLLNNRCASILFDTGADRSFVSTQFSTLINITPTTLDHGYNVELADGRIIWVNTVLLGCTLNFLNHPFHVDLMPVEMGTYDVIIGMDWLTKYQAVIDCAKKIVRIPFGSEILIFHGDGSRNKRGTRLNIISCTKAQKYLLQGCHVFLAHITIKETGDKSKKCTGK
ncbi:putative reverse transcriptase domain-containing protein [Tanacetum coccineum]